MGHRVQCRYCPKRYKTKTSRKPHEKSCTEARQGRWTRKNEGIIGPATPAPIGARESVSSDLVYVIPVDGLKYQEDIRAENVGPDSKGEIDVDDLLEESMETEETQGKISQEDLDLEEGSGEEIQELRAPKPLPPETQ